MAESIDFNAIDDEKKIVIYQTEDGQTAIDVKLENDTVWLNRLQMAQLFDRDVKTIGKHINNALKEELKGFSVVAKFATTAADGKTYQVEHYNIEMITSVGYRVKSKRGTQFRIWANRVLKEYLIKGYAINSKAAFQHYNELKQSVQVLGRTANAASADGDINSLINVVTDYAYALDTLDRYDYRKLTVEKTTFEEKFHATYENAMQVIRTLKKQFGGSIEEPSKTARELAKGNLRSITSR